MAEIGKLQINILGTSFEIQANEEPEYLKTLYSNYAHMIAQVEKSSGVADPLKIAIIAGILIQDELEKEKLKLTALPQEKKEVFEIEQLTKRMLSNIDTAIDGSSE